MIITLRCDELSYAAVMMDATLFMRGQFWCWKDFIRHLRASEDHLMWVRDSRIVLKLWTNIKVMSNFWSCVIEVEKNRNFIHSRRNNFQLFMLIFHFKSLLSSQITTTLGTTKNEWRIPKRWKTMDDDLYTSQTGRIGIDWSYLRLYLMSYVNSKRLSTYIIDFIRYDTVHCVCLSFFSFPSRTRLMADHIPCLAWN